MFVSVDIPYKILKEAVERAEKKIGICKVLPSVRFMIHENPFFGPPNEWFISTLVCDQLGGKSTGVSAEYCKNCILPFSSNKEGIETNKKLTKEK